MLSTELLCHRPDLRPLVSAWLLAEWPAWYGPGGPGDVERDVHALAKVLLGLGAVGEAVAGEDEGEHDASLGGPSRGTMPAGGTSETPMSDDEPTPAHDTDAPDASHADDHGGGHGDHHDGGTLGPIAWRMWGVGILGVVVALIVVAAAPLCMTRPIPAA